MLPVFFRCFSSSRSSLVEVLKQWFTNEEKIQGDTGEGGESAPSPLVEGTMWATPTRQRTHS